MDTMAFQRCQRGGSGRGRRLAKAFLLFLSPLVLLSSAAARARCNGADGQCEEGARVQDFAELDLEDLLNVVITSVSKGPENLRESAAAVYVLTGDEIRQSGATSLGEALRIVPGLDVAQIDGSRFAISARGFHRYYAVKMLVLIDGRSTYTSLLAGTLWEQWDVFLDDVDRIEVIRGPGGTTWGANAVNGVINIITKSAKNTTGLLVRQSGGTDTFTYSGGRWGGRLGDSFWYRGYVQHNQDGGVGEPTNPAGAHDGRKVTRGGFRLDGTLGERNTVMAEGEYGNGAIEQVNVIALASGAPKVAFHDELRLGHFLTKVERDLDRWGSAFLQGYYDRVYRNANVVGRFRDDIGTFDVELQHRLPLFAGNEAMWGLSYRWYDFNVGRGENVSFGRIGREQILAAKIADEWRITDKLKVGAGSKIENNSFTGTEFEPNIHASYMLTPTQTLWAAVSRAVRIPSLLDRELVLNNAGMTIDPETGSLILLRFKDTNQVTSEKLVAYEAGWRGRIARRADFDLALFFNDYDDAEDFASVLGDREIIPTTPPTIIQDLNNRSRSAGYSFGGEILWRFQLTSWWHSELSYSFEKFKNTVDRRDPAMPDHKVNLRQRLSLPYGAQGTASIYWIDRIQVRSEGNALEKIDPYTRFDLSLSKWCLNDHLLVEIVGQNLVQGKHVEYFDQFQTGMPVVLGRRVWGGLTFSY